MCIVILEFGFISVFNFKELNPWSHGCVTGGKCPGGICLGLISGADVKRGAIVWTPNSAVCPID